MHECNLKEFSNIMASASPELLITLINDRVNVPVDMDLHLPTLSQSY